MRSKNSILLCWLVGLGMVGTTFIVAANQRANSGFQPPTETERVRAVGSLRDLSSAESAVYQDDSDFFAPINKPRAHDWLGAHREAGQTFDQYRASLPLRPDGTRSVIYVQPIGEFDDELAPDLTKLLGFAKAFFQGVEVKLAPAIDLEELGANERINSHSGKRQILSTDILEALEERLPEDAYCVLAVTMTDLYPDPSWNFVFGQASLRDRAGVFSFARYHPSFFGEQPDEKTEALVLARSCKVLVHEVGHMFGIRHCVHFECIMNGSNHLEESDSKPPRLCPVCLRKLQWNLEFAPRERYRKLLEWNQEANFDEDADWLVRRLEQIGE